MHTESASDEKWSIVKESLHDFLTSQVPNADLNAMDDVIFTYVYAAVDAVDSTPDEFYGHVNDLIEIMTAYVKDFNKIDRDAVYVWLMDVVSRLAEDKQKPYMDEAAKPEEKPQSKMDSLSFHIPKESPAKLSSSNSKSSSSASSRSNSTSEDDFKFPMSAVDKSSFEAAVEASKKQTAGSPEPEQYPGHVKFLTEMFPESSPIEIKHCVSIALGDIERAMATLIHRREHGQALCPVSLVGSKQRAQLCGNHEIKSRIIERYSYVDRESETKEHKPLAPKQEAKKMVRYRDNKIVSLKGERYTEVSKGEEEGVKKPNKKNHP